MIDRVTNATYTTPTGGRAAEVHTARHLTLFTVLSTHGLGITVRCAALATEVRTITADALGTTATFVRAFTALAVQRTIVTLVKRTS